MVEVGAIPAEKRAAMSHNTLRLAGRCVLPRLQKKDAKFHNQFWEAPVTVGDKIDLSHKEPYEIYKPKGGNALEQKQDCMLKCAKWDKCTSFQWSPTEKMCRLRNNKYGEEKPAGYKDYIYCVHRTPFYVSCRVSVRDHGTIVLFWLTHAA